MRLIRSEHINISLRFGQRLRTSVKLGGKFMDVFHPMGERVLKCNSAFLKVAGSALAAKIEVNSRDVKSSPDPDKTHTTGC